MTDPDSSDRSVEPSARSLEAFEARLESLDDPPESMAEVHTRITSFARALRGVMRAVEAGEDASDEELRDIRRGLEVIELALAADQFVAENGVGGVGARGDTVGEY